MAESTNRYGVNVKGLVLKGDGPGSERNYRGSLCANTCSGRSESIFVRFAASWTASVTAAGFRSRPLCIYTWRHWTKDSPLMESGLLGPVRLQVSADMQLSP
jgi:hypothetical protein